MGRLLDQLSWQLLLVLVLAWALGEVTMAFDLGIAFGVLRLLASFGAVRNIALPSSSSPSKETHPCSH